jgi:hypothetical protein
MELKATCLDRRRTTRHRAVGSDGGQSGKAHQPIPRAPALIIITVMAVDFLGDVLQDALDLRASVTNRGTPRRRRLTMRPRRNSRHDRA